VQHWAEERDEQRRTSGVGVKVLKWATTSAKEGIRVIANVGARGVASKTGAVAIGN
jgi:hypothetical protein